VASTGLSAKYIDLKISDDDLALDETGQPFFVYDIDVIYQDLMHAIRESQLIENLIGERSSAKRKLVFNKLRLLVEQDSRVEPGTCEVEVVGLEQIYIRAETEFGVVSVGAEI
jgi:hypothetical protein